MRLRSLGLMIALAPSLVAAALAVAAQPAGKVPRVGYLSLSSSETDGSWVTAFEQGLRDLGYVEGKNIVIEQRYAGGRIEKLPDLVAELLRLKVDLFVTFGTQATLAAQKASTAIPIVMANEPDPVGTGLVASLAHPGGNVTGLSDLHADLAPKRLQFLKEAVPSASRVAVLLNPATPHAVIQLKHLQVAAPVAGVTLLPVEVRGPDHIDRAFATLRKERPGGLLIIPEVSWTAGRQGRIADLALKSRLPAIGTGPRWGDVGFLMSYGTDFHVLWRRAATYVDKILKGAKPADLPVEQPTRFELVINMKTAKALGLTFPPSILVRADRVIQ